MSLRALCCVALVATAFAAPALAAVPAARNLETVTFASIDRDAAGRNVALKGFLLLPRTPAPPGGYPAVIALHGCGGLHSTRRGHEQELAERLALRADRYLADGFAVLFPDSFGARGVRAGCTIKLGERPATSGRAPPGRARRARVSRASQ